MHGIQRKKNKAKNKKYFERGLLFAVSVGVIFIFSSEIIFAAGPDGVLENIAQAPFQLLLYGLFKLIGWFLSVAITLFAYAVDPALISGPSGWLNLQATYDMWKFVRDIINVAFILGLLFIAFAFIFQIKGYSDKQVILKLVFAALLVNFSFPISRVIIDLANVPMYFFLQMIVGTGGSATTLSESLGASGLQRILLPDGITSDVSILLAGVIFLFIFTVTLLVLAFQFLIRLIALLLLVILSPIGFVAPGIPGMKKYGSKWWDNFLNYALFGPAAMFMLLLSTNLFAAISQDNSQFDAMSNIAREGSVEPNFIAAMALFFVPITLLWFTIGLSGKFSMAGAALSTGYAKKFLKGAGRRTYNNRFTRGIKKGATERAEKAPVLGRFMPKNAKESREAQEAAMAGFVGGGVKGYQKSAEKLHNKKVGEEEKKFEESRTSEADLRKTMAEAHKNSKEKVEAAVNILSRKDALRSEADITDAFRALAIASGAKKDPTTGKVDTSNLSLETKEKIRQKSAEIIKKAGGEIYSSSKGLASAIQMLGDDVKGVGGLIDKANSKALSLSPTEYDVIAKTSPMIKGKLDSKLKKEGKAKVLIDVEVNDKAADIASGKTSVQEIYNERLSKMTAKDIAKMDDVHGDSTTPMDPQVLAFLKDQIGSKKWSPKDHQDAFSELNSAQKEAWRKAGVAPTK